MLMHAELSATCSWSCGGVVYLERFHPSRSHVDVVDFVAPAKPLIFCFVCF